MASDDEHSGERRRRRRRRRHSSGERRRREEGYDREEHADEESGDGRGRRRRPVDYGRLAGLAIVAAVAVAAVAGGIWYYNKVTSPTALALTEARKMPLVGLVIADQPGAEGRLKAAIEEDSRQPNKDGLSRESAVVSELRNEYIAPTLRRADDASLIATMAARAALIDHLNKTDTRVCREFGLGGIQHPEKLDPEGQRLFKNLLTAVEAAYRSGRSSNQTPPMPTLQQIGNVLVEAGFIKSDFDKLNSFATLSNDVTCYIELKINQVPAKLSAEKQGPYSRYILGN